MLHTHQKVVVRASSERPSSCDVAPVVCEPTSPTPVSLPAHHHCYPTRGCCALAAATSASATVGAGTS